MKEVTQYNNNARIQDITLKVIKLCRWMVNVCEATVQLLYHYNIIPTNSRAYRQYGVLSSGLATSTMVLSVKLYLLPEL